MMQPEMSFIKDSKLKVEKLLKVFFTDFKYV